MTVKDSRLFLAVYLPKSKQVKGRQVQNSAVG
jgi:hypothetical protein